MTFRIKVRPGAGGEESKDFARMLARMYVRRAERAGASASLKDDEVIIGGVDDDTIVRAETGIHRLVRVSPFDAQGRRHTSFAAVSVNDEHPHVQVRSYVLDPYKLVRDASGWQRKDVDAYLDGETEF